MRATAWAFSGIAVTAALAGCALVTDLNASDYSLAPAAGGTGDGGTGDGGTCGAIGSSSGQFTSGNAMCDGCLVAQCCGPSTTCFALAADGGPSDCTLLARCIAACDAGSTSCAVSCAGTYPGGVNAGAALEGCVTTSCGASSCGAL